MEALEAKSEVINKTLWYVNPENVRDLLTSFSQELLAEKREEIRAKKEVVDKDNPLMGLTDQYHQNGWNAALDEALTILGEK